MFPKVILNALNDIENVQLEIFLLSIICYKAMCLQVFYNPYQ